VTLAEKLGRLAVQLVSGVAGVKDVKVTYLSARADDDLDTRLLRAMITKGLIEPVSDAFINLVNADYVAKQRGLRISEERQPSDGAIEVPLDTIQVNDIGAECVCYQKIHAICPLSCMRFFVIVLWGLWFLMFLPNSHH
jgi:D-3-phosphoglycerate dehydrogenase